MRDARVFMLPSSEGDEIEVAKSHGALERNIHICDSNPAIVAVLKRRFRACVSHGIPAERALDKPGARYHLINLDVCQTALFAGTGGAERAAYGALCTGGVLAVTWQKGRDREMAYLARLSAAAGSEVSRLSWLGRFLSATHAVGGKGDGTLRRLYLVRHNQYRLGAVPMEWAAWVSRVDGALSPADLKLENAELGLSLMSLAVVKECIKRERAGDTSSPLTIADQVLDDGSWKGHLWER
jgi:hypothetical protein